MYSSPNNYLGDQIKKNEIGRKCSKNGKEERSIQGLWWGNARWKGHTEDLGIDGRIILKRFFRNRTES